MSSATQPPTSDDPNAAKWYVAKPGGQREGPLPMGILKARSAGGQLNPDDLIWTQGFAGWQAARTIPDLFGPATGAPSSSAAAAISTAQASATLLKSFADSVSSPSFLRITGRIFGAVALLLLLASMPLWFIGYSWFMNAWFFAFVFIVCEVLAHVVESQQRIEALLQPRQDNKPGA